MMCATALGATAYRADVPPTLKIAPRNGAVERAKGMMPRRAWAALKASPLKAANSDETIEMYIDNYNTDWVYYDYSGDWYCTFMTEANGSMYDFHLDIYTNKLPGHYTLADLDDFYTWCRKDEVEFHFSEADITITESTKSEGKYVIDATVRTTLDETLHIVVDPAAPSHEDIIVEGDEMVSCNYYAPDWNISFEQYNRYRVVLDMQNPEDPENIEGTYTADDCRLGLCSLYDVQTGIERQFDDLQFTVVGDDPQGDLEITGSGVLTDGIKVNFHFHQTLPIQATQTIDLTDATLESFLFHDPMCTHKASFTIRSEEQQVEFKVSYDGTKGTYNEFYWAFSSLTDLTTGEVIGLDNGIVTVSFDDLNQVHIDGSLTFKNAIAYNFDVTRMLDVKGQKSVEAHNMAVTNLMGFINYLIASNDEYTSIQASTTLDLQTGDYTDAMVFTLNGTDGSMCYSLVVKEASLVQDSDGNFELTARFLADDMVDYNLFMDFKMPEIESEDTFTSTNATLRDLTLDYGSFQIYGYDTTGQDYLSIVLDDWYVHSATYTELSTVNRDYCQIIRHLGQADEEVLPLYSCNLSLAIDGNGFTITGTCQAGSVLYTVNVAGQLEVEEPAGDAYDDPDNDINISFTTDEINRYDVQPELGYAAIGARNESGESFLTLIYLNGDELTPGDYEINNSYTPGTVQAGSVSGTNVYPTFFMQYDEEGNITLPLWLCTSGWVKVSYDDDGDLQLVIDAVNSWGRFAHIVLNESDNTGIKTVGRSDQTSPVKFIQNHQVKIRRGEKVYDLLGR